VAQEAVDGIVDVLVLREEDVAAEVEAEAVLPEGAAQPARHRRPLQHLGGMPEEAVQGQAADPAAENADVHHPPPHEKRTLRMRRRVHHALCSGRIVVCPIRSRYSMKTTFRRLPILIGRSSNSTGRAAPLTS